MEHLIHLDPSPHRILDLALRAICNLDQGKGLLTVADFKAASSSLHPQFKREALKQYQYLQEIHKSSDHYSCEIALRASEHLLERELIVYSDFRDRSGAIEFRPVQL